jgi:hypothetical protein
MIHASLPPRAHAPVDFLELSGNVPSSFRTSLRRNAILLA